MRSLECGEWRVELGIRNAELVLRTRFFFGGALRESLFSCDVDVCTVWAAQAGRFCK